MRLIPSPPGIISGGEIIFHSKNGVPTNLLELSEEEMRKLEELTRPDKPSDK